MRVEKFLFIGFVLVIVALAVFVQTSSAATSLTGTTGLVSIPTAYIVPDGKISFGIGYTDRDYSLQGPKYAQVAYYATAGYFPFLEVSLRLTAFPGLMQPGNYGSAKDRMASIKLRVLNERQYLPSILLGSIDIFTTPEGDYLKINPEYKNKHPNAMHFNSEYIVISKSIHPKILDYFGIHLGYATKLFKAANYSMGGMFIGFDAKLCEFLTIMGEYDTEKYNAGLRIMPFGDRVNIDIDALGMKHLSGGSSFSFEL